MTAASRPTSCTPAPTSRHTGLVVVPTLYLVTDEHAAAIAAAAEAGAQVLVTFFSGIATEDDHVRLGGYPGAFRELLGVRVEEFFPLMPGSRVALGQGEGRLWSEDVTAVDCEVVDRYAAGPLAGGPRSPVGDRGGCCLVPQHPPRRQHLGALLETVATAAGVTPAAEVPVGVEVTRRRGAEGSWLFLLNDTDSEQQIRVSGHDVVTDGPVGPTITLAPGAVAVVRED